MAHEGMRVQVEYLCGHCMIINIEPDIGIPHLCYSTLDCLGCCREEWEKASNASEEAETEAEGEEDEEGEEGLGQDERVIMRACQELDFAPISPELTLLLEARDQSMTPTLLPPSYTIRRRKICSQHRRKAKMARNSRELPEQQMQPKQEAKKPYGSMSREEGARSPSPELFTPLPSPPPRALTPSPPPSPPPPPQHRLHCPVTRGTSETVHAIASGDPTPIKELLTAHSKQGGKKISKGSSSSQRFTKFHGSQFKMACERLAKAACFWKNTHALHHESGSKAQCSECSREERRAFGGHPVDFPYPPTYLPHPPINIPYHYPNGSQRSVRSYQGSYPPAVPVLIHQHPNGSAGGMHIP